MAEPRQLARPVPAGVEGGAVRVYPVIERQIARNGLRRIARRAGWLDAHDWLGDLTVAALRRARLRAAAKGCTRDDIDEVTLEGLDQGRAQA